MKLDFWEAYSRFREAHPISTEQLAAELKASFSTVYSWDQRAKKGDDAKHGRTPSRSNKQRLAEIAEAAGVAKRIVDGLRPEFEVEVARP